MSVVHPSTAREEPDEVPHVAVTEGRAVDSWPRGVEMFVSPDVHPLVGGHGEVGDLVELAGEEEDDPAECEELEGGECEE